MTNEEADLHDYQTGKYLREATEEEAEESKKAATKDDEVGVILVEGISCFVEAY